MKIGTRITLTTVTLVLLTLGLYGWVSLRTRRAELISDLERQMSLMGTSVRISLEAALKNRRFEDTPELVARWQEAEPNIRFIYLDIAHSHGTANLPSFIVTASPEPSKGEDAGAPPHYRYLPAPFDGTRAQRLQRMAIDKHPIGEHIELGGRPVYALMEPLRDEQGRVVGAMELLRDESDALDALTDSRRAVVWALVALSALLTALVGLATRQSISNPLKRLVEAIDDVTRGDLGRVILRERDDEVGDLAERFNEMTHSLREAREQILAGVDAKLALEARLRHSEKLATIGQLAAGIAHEVGTPLNVIGGRARQLAKKAGESTEAAKIASIIAAQTQRITKIIQQLLDFARRPASVRTSVDLQAVAKGTLDFLEHQLTTARVLALLHPFTIEATRTGEATAAVWPPESALVYADADQLQQVCLNLCINAIQAMPQGGTLDLSTYGLVRRRPGLDAAEPGRYVVLEVADTGVGIPESDRERIFEPFYSTKPFHDGGKEGGTGLGLAVSVGIVKDHDGWIEIDTRNGGGTIFRIFLPASEGPELSASTAL